MSFFIRFHSRKVDVSYLNFVALLTELRDNLTGKGFLRGTLHKLKLNCTFELKLPDNTDLNEVNMIFNYNQ